MATTEAKSPSRVRFDATVCGDEESMEEVEAEVDVKKVFVEADLKKGGLLEALGGLQNVLNFDAVKRPFANGAFKLLDRAIEAVNGVTEEYIEPIVEVVKDVGHHWYNSGVLGVVPDMVRRRRIREEMKKSQTYDEWRALALELDRLEGRQAWKSEFKSDLYDSELIETKLETLRQARNENDIPNMMYQLRAGLKRNIGGLGHPGLYEQTHVGTKKLIEQYTEEVVYQLNMIAQRDDPAVSLAEKVEFFRDTRQAFGRSALLLSGGGAWYLPLWASQGTLGQQSAPTCHQWFVCWEFCSFFHLHHH
eukprot:Colp12_sorted_trinity150504_noHs@6451